MFDKNKIIVNEQLIRVPKLKLKTNKRRKRKKLTNTSGINNNNNSNNNTNINNLRTSTLLNSIAPPLGNPSHRNNNQNNLAQSTSLSLSQRSRVDSLINNLKAYDLISGHENYEAAANLSDLQLSGRTVKKSSKSIKSSSNSADMVGATNLEQMFSGGILVKSRKTARNELQPVVLSCDSSLSSIAAKTYKSNDNENEDDDENYSNINFDEGNYDKLQLQQNGEVKKREITDGNVEGSGNIDDLNIGFLNSTSLPLNQSNYLNKNFKH